MREKMEKTARSKYNDVIVWEYFETCGTCYMRFTSVNRVYIMSMQKAGSHATIFRGEESVLI